MKKQILPCLVALTGLLAAESVPFIIPNVGTVSKPDPHAAARMVVMTEIAMRLQPKIPPFSRAMPAIPHPSYRAVELVDGEERLPFTVTMLRLKNGVEVSGYVRLSDNAIFIHRPGEKEPIPSTQDPRFAPLKTTQASAEKPT